MFDFPKKIGVDREGRAFTIGLLEKYLKIGETMKIDVQLGENLKVNAIAGDFTIHTDQPESVGGDNSAPGPFVLFLSSIATCAGFYVSKFCQSREIPTDDIKISLESDFNKEEKCAENIEIQISLPESFPKKYEKALLRAIDQCTVKKTIKKLENLTVRLI